MLSPGAADAGAVGPLATADADPPTQGAGPRRGIIEVARGGWDELKRRVREANDIVDVVGAAVQLKRAGRSYKALCPFHNEKTPSFHVNPERQTFKCFGCGEGGDVFTFVEKTDNVEFKEAMAILAERAGIALEVTPEARREATIEKQRKLHIYRTQEVAQRFFAERLASVEGRAARDYLSSRGMYGPDGQLARDWGLGFAPDRWDGLAGRYATSGPKQRLLVASGLARERDSGGVYDVFRSRLMFPIRDTQGRIVGFGGRVLGEGEPKYLNTPETAVFAKGRLLYGLERARRAVSEAGEALVVEGYTDVIRCHEYGFENAVATLGTALGAEHLRLLRRLGAERVVLVFDADAAGVRAAERGLEILLEEDVAGAVVSLPGGRDPCEFLAEEGADAFRDAVAGAEDAFEFKVAQLLADVAGREGSDEIRARAEAARELMGAASRSDDPVKRALLRKRVSERLGVPEEALEFDRRRRPAGRTPGALGRGEGRYGDDAGHGDGDEDYAAFDLSARPSADERLDRRAERELAALLACFPEGLKTAREEADLDNVEDALAREVIAAVALTAGEAAGETPGDGPEGFSEPGEDLDSAFDKASSFDDRRLLDRLTEESTAFVVDALEEAARDRRGGTTPERIAERMAERVKKAAIALWMRRARARLDELTAELSGLTKEAEAGGPGEEGAAERDRLLRERQELIREMHARRARSDPDARRRLAARKR